MFIDFYNAAHTFCAEYNKGFAASGQSISWAEGLSWQQVKQKAKDEKKYIFIDAYATWCGPCKVMDKKIYSNDTVAKFINKHFVSVKVQMDKSENDDESIKAWYKDAEAIKSKYKVDAFPTFIFLSPMGEIVHMDKGYKDVSQFIEAADTALVSGRIYVDPYAEYDLLVQDYKNGIKHYDRIPYMFNCALKLGDTDFASLLVKEHSQFIANLSKEKRYTKENIEMWKEIGLGSKTRIFRYFYKDGEFIDRVMGKKGYAEDVVDNTIRFEFINPFFKQQQKDTTVIMEGLYQLDDGKLKPSYEEADWKKLHDIIINNVNKYYAKKNMLWAKMEWYQRHRRYNESGKFALDYLSKYFLFEFDNTSILNDHAFTAFKYSTDKKVIDGYILLLEKLMKVRDVYCGILDTYANLLYKSGKTQDAIQWELKAEEKAIGIFSFKKETYKKIIEQMKRGVPTWGAIWGYK